MGNQGWGQPVENQGNKHKGESNRVLYMNANYPRTAHGRCLEGETAKTAIDF